MADRREEQENEAPPPRAKPGSAFARRRRRAMDGQGLAGFHYFGQGLFGIAGTIALIVAAILYFQERRDKPRIVLQPTATVVHIGGRDASAEGQVLLQVSVGIENRGTRSLLAQCAAIDLIGIVGSEERARIYGDDLDGRSLLVRTGRDSDPAEEQVWRNCLAFEDRRRLAEQRWLAQAHNRSRYVNPPQPTAQATSGSRYRDFFMEPGESVSRTWEQRVPCTFEAVRIIFKLPKPGSFTDYETKIIVPIADVCSRRRDVSVHRFASRTGAGDEGATKEERDATAGDGGAGDEAADEAAAGKNGSN